MTYTIAIIGARQGSKGVPGKNIRPLAGHPLLAYSIRTAKLAGNIQRVIISTDSPEYAQIAYAAGAEVIMRPPILASDTATDYQWIDHFLQYTYLQEPRQPDLLVHLRPTTPLRDPAVVAEAVNMLVGSPDATSLRAVHPMGESAYKCFELEYPYLNCVGGATLADGANAPRQSFPTTYHANGYVDVLKVGFVQTEKLLHGGRSLAFITPPAIEVDTEEDFAYLEWQVARDPSLVARLFGGSTRAHTV